MLFFLEETFDSLIKNLLWILHPFSKSGVTFLCLRKQECYTTPHFGFPFVSLFILNFLEN